MTTTGPAASVSASAISTSAIETLDQRASRRGADLLLEVLASEGVEFIFGNPGTTELPLMDALAGRPDISYIWGLQEASVVAMADGYAQAARRPGFVNLHTAGGLGHGFGNLLNANVAGTPLVVTAGQQDSRHTITDPLLVGDLVSIARPAVKWAQEVIHPDQIPVLIRRALHDSSAAPSGPVFLSLPMDVMQERTSASPGQTSVIDRRSVACSLEALADLLLAVPPGRLALIAGDEIDISDAAPEAVRVAEILGADVFGSSWPARIPFPTSHALWAGNLPPSAAGIASHLKDFDCLFALGGKSLITILYTEDAVIPASCDVLQLSSDVRDLGRTYPTRLSMTGDIKRSLDVLIKILESRPQSKNADYKRQIEHARSRRIAHREDLGRQADAQLAQPVVSPLVAAREIVRGCGPAIPIIDEAVATAAHVRSFLDSSSARQYSFLRGGGLGWGMPAAVGFSLGFGRSPVVSLVGDGAAMYSPQAIWTAAYEKLPVTFVILNNREYNILKNFMRRQKDYLSLKHNRFIAMDLTDPPIDFAALAASMGVPSLRVERASDIAGAIAAGIASGRPNLIEIVISA